MQSLTHYPKHEAASENGVAEAVAPEPAADSGEIREPTALELVELLLKTPAAVDWLNRRADMQRLLFPRLLLIAETSYLVYGLVMVLVLNIAPAAAYPH